MTEAELTAHFAAVMNALPESAVSARQALYSGLAEIDRMQKRLAQLTDFERAVRGAVIDLNAPGAIVITAQTSATKPAPASPPRLSLVKSPEVAP